MKKISCLLSVLIAIMLIQESYAQEEQSIEHSKVNMGFGMGLDYGGFGGRLSVLPSKNFSVFGAIGYNLFEAGLNAGVQARLLPDNNVCPVLGAMYGYNGVIVIKGAEEYNKTYYGPSFSFGLEFKSTKNPKNFYVIELLLPIRPKEFNQDFNELENDPYIKIETKPLPIGFSFGIHFGV
jgi:hypothetical protein